MAMRFDRIVVSLSALLLVPIVSWAACTGSSPMWASTPDYTSVNSCVSQAQNGDRINVSVGSATWASTLSFTKAISIIGAGIGNTVITAVAYELFAITLSTNTYLTRISGFTFNLSGTHKAIDPA